MRHFFTKLLVCISLMLVMHTTWAVAQTTISGKVTDDGGQALPGVNIAIKGTVTGTITDVQGNFSLSTSAATPFTLVISSVGFAPQEIEITGSRSDIEVKLAEQTILGQEVVVSASRVEENIMKSPVTVEKMDIISIQQAPTPDFYDGIAKLKGVQSTSGSLTFNSINTRGFATIANVRFVQLIDGMDNAAPLLNFPTGNIVGISDLDVESVELVPGAGSALYGPNAFNGILFMNSKSPFDYQGLSANAKIGITSSNTAGPGATAHGTNPYYQFSARYAKAFNNKFAFKVNFSMLDATDWSANNYNNYRTDVSNYNNPNNPAAGSPSFDGLNTYGDEVPLAVNFLDPATTNTIAAGIVASPTFASTLNGAFGGNTALAQGIVSNYFLGLGNQLRNTTGGFVSFPRISHKEEDIIDNYKARSIKADAALHYRINDRLELIYNYRYGTGSSIYQGAERYALRNFNIQFNKLELKGKNFFVRAYTSQTDAGDSYNLTALGTYMNLRMIQGSVVPAFASVALAGGLQTFLGTGVLPSVTAINNYASQAYTARLTPGTQAYNDLANSVRNDYFKRTPTGARFIDNSRLYHAEFNYNFRDVVKFAEIQVGGNVRRYDLFSDGTIFNENRDGEGNKRITIDEYGAYVQASKTMLGEHLKITASIRHDKNQNFKGQWNPRASAVYSFGKDLLHNIRASFQTGFRNPDTQAQFIYFPSASGTLLGSTKANAESYGIHEKSDGSVVDVNGKPVTLRYIQPERLQAFEIGYKGIFANKLLLDFNYYYNSYKDFIAAQTVVSTTGGFVPGTGSFAPGTAFRPYVNADVPITSQGIGLGLTYKLPKNYILTGNYSWADYKADLPAGSTFEVGFNTPRNKFNIGVGNREVFKNFGFDISYRWQTEFLWQSAFANGYVPAFGVVDAQVNYKMKSIKSVLKLGATNLGGKDYITNVGGPNVGQLYYLSITFDQFMR